MDSLKVIYSSQIFLRIQYDDIPGTSSLSKLSSANALWWHGLSYHCKAILILILPINLKEHFLFGWMVFLVRSVSSVAPYFITKHFPKAFCVELMLEAAILLYFFLFLLILSFFSRGNKWLKTKPGSLFFLYVSVAIFYFCNFKSTSCKK